MSVSEKISTLWIVVMFNMAFADILSFISPGFLAQVSAGVIEGVEITPMFILLAAVLIEIAIVMIFLSRALSRKANRIANFGAVAITILFVVGGGSLKPHYIFFGSIEVLAMLYIAYLAWTWPEDRAHA
ncbi:DUF6326 family protein [Maritalea mediterranea]|uniref:DUF6326 family protein n=1 Tax=Maritalea mediterranea TaxID=2909667 RepID=A0ABS9E9C7_9HYPH|nr:DUF6326 family protein [Maritalea mediterranea]MCF4099473.1 DUF6326 family protein [Maritalea mediterranea]